MVRKMFRWLAVTVGLVVLATIITGLVRLAYDLMGSRSLLSFAVTSFVIFQISIWLAEKNIDEKK